MAVAGRLRSASFVILCLGLVTACGLFGAPLGFKPSVRWALVIVQAPLLCGAAWMSGFDLMRSSAAPHGRQLVAAMLLILPIALFSLMPGFGPPEFTDHAHNAYRYEVLFVDVVLVATGLLVLHDALRAVGKRHTPGWGSLWACGRQRSIWSGRPCCSPARAPSAMAEAGLPVPGTTG